MVELIERYLWLMTSAFLLGKLSSTWVRRVLSTCWQVYGCALLGCSFVVILLGVQKLAWLPCTDFPMIFLRVVLLLRLYISSNTLSRPLYPSSFLNLSSRRTFSTPRRKILFSDKTRRPTRSKSKPRRLRSGKTKVATPREHYYSQTRATSYSPSAVNSRWASVCDVYDVCAHASISFLRKHLQRARVSVSFSLAPTTLTSCKRCQSLRA